MLMLYIHIIEAIYFLLRILLKILKDIVKNNSKDNNKDNDKDNDNKYSKKTKQALHTILFYKHTTHNTRNTLIKK